MQGRQFTSHDVKFNFERLLGIGEFEGAPELKWGSPWLVWVEIESMENARRLDLGDQLQPAGG